jgi:DNA-binding MarR family transcriptional regulator
MTGLLARLEASSWVQRSASPEDRRASRLKPPAIREALLRARYATATPAVAVVPASHSAVAVVVELCEELSVRALSPGQRGGLGGLPTGARMSSVQLGRALIGSAIAHLDDDLVD